MKNEVWAKGTGSLNPPGVTSVRKGLARVRRGATTIAADLFVCISVIRSSNSNQSRSWYLEDRVFFATVALVSCI